MEQKKTLLVIAHAPSPNTQRMLDAVVEGASHPDIENVTTRFLPPLEIQPKDLIAADALILGTTENLGYMSGLIKDMFDRCYYPCLDHTQGKPFAFYIRAGHDGTGTRKAIETITTGLRWRSIQPPLVCRGDFDEDFVSQCNELGMMVAASLDAGII